MTFFDPNVFAPIDTSKQSSGQNGAFWRWLDDHGESVTDTTGGLLCILNPRRPGCSGDPLGFPNQPPPQQANNNVIWILVALVVILLLVFILKK